jgi:two-component system OmpR family response regulator
VRVLVVEDEPRMAVLLERGFRQEGYAVDVAHDGTDGLWLATENEYDAVVLDVLLPGIDGFEVCRQMRATERWAPVLLLTARDAVDDRVHGLDAGADDYLTKPFSFAELAARVRALGRRRGGSRPAVLVVGDLRLDPATHQAWRGEVELPLSPKEMALLELLMRHAGEVVTRTQILDHVWDFAYDGVSNVVDQYVAYLRRKVDRPFARTDIETVRGVGYRLRDPDQA